jgi:hypothetical protein
MRFSVGRKQKPQLARATSKAVDIPAPIGGLNTRDSLSAMPPTDALQLVNYIPQQSGLKSRLGYTTATGTLDFFFSDSNNFYFADGNNFVFTGSSDTYSGAVETTIPYIQGLTSLMITASGGELYSDNTSGTLTTLGTGFGNARWEGEKLGVNMVLVNGADAPQNFNGTTLSTPSFTGDLATYGAANINGIHKHRNRIYMYDTDYGNFFVGGVNAVSGDFDEFQLDRVSNTGGNITCIKSITKDAGDGIDDYLAIMLNTGEVILYQGSDPTDADNFALVGKFMMPPLINRRCATEFSGDIICLTKQDVIKLSDVIKYTSESGGFNTNPSKLSGAITNDYNTYGDIWGYQITTYPRGGWIIINIPEVEAQAAHQYVINVVTGASTQFMGWEANCFGVLNNNLYFGEEARTCLADSGLSDDGADIQLIGRQAFTNLGISQRKKINNVKLFIQADGALDIDLSVAYDFGVATPQGTQGSVATGVLWDTVLWDTASWSSVQSSTLSFTTAGLGVYTSIQKNLSIQGQQINWYATTYNFDTGKAF